MAMPDYGRIASERENTFPRLVLEGYRKTSEETIDYNCVAWAMGDSSTDKWWQPSDGYYWPDAIPKGTSITTFVRLFSEICGYEKCPTESFEMGYERIAIYGIDGNFRHVARQKPTGKWTSKLGDFEDIEHESLSALESESEDLDSYGKVIVIMRRRSASAVISSQPT